MPGLRYSLLASWLRRYFYSGWAFLMPYLFAYLLYYATKWPVNAAGAAAAAAGNGSEVIGDGAIASTAHNLSPIASHLGSIPIPCLLHLYWALHAIHAVLAGVAVYSWLQKVKGERREVIGTKPDSNLQPCPPASDIRPLTSSAWPLASGFSSIAIRLAPWALLALIFYIPGVYLEWPSDPWEHLRRINEWRILDTVGAHSSWMKSSYFIPYSLLSWCIGLRQLFWLDFYYTGICLLLCWQYYRFSRACGLGERASMVFVIIQALLFGNNIFSFYRYYGISSSIYAQLGAIALTRIFLEWAARGTKLVGPSLVDAPSVIPATDTQSDPTHNLLPIAYHPSPIPAPPLALGIDSALKPYLLPLITAVTCLIALTAMNHPQGLGIAALGIAAVIIWRFIEWKRSTLWWLVGATVIINALFLWLYPRPAIIETYRAQGYLSAWYGFNIFALNSPAGDRMLQIVSAFGTVNLAAACFLLRRNHAVAWLTLTPLLAAALPCVTIAFAQVAFKAGGDQNIVTFQRLLFALPSYLAVVSFLSRFWPSNIPVDPVASSTRARFRQFTNKQQFYGIAGVALTFAALAALVIIPSSAPAYNRLWDTSATVAADLQLRDIAAKCESTSLGSINNATTKIVGPKATIDVFSSLAAATRPCEFRSIDKSVVSSLSSTLAIIETVSGMEAQFHDAGNERMLSLALSSQGLPEKQSSLGDSLGMYPKAWTTFSGPPPEFVAIENTTPHAQMALQNYPGTASQIFSSTLFKLDRQKHYSFELNIRQRYTTSSTVYLAVAWYNQDGKLLDSSATIPLGAGAPQGWGNGVFSYFGLAGQPAPRCWARFRISFGQGEPAEIPFNARYLRVGALLNYNHIPSAVIQLSDVQFYEKERWKLCLIPSDPRAIYSAGSQASLLSMHWLPQQGLVDRGGIKEILSAAEAIHIYTK